MLGLKSARTHFPSPPRGSHSPKSFPSLSPTLRNVWLIADQLPGPRFFWEGPACLFRGRELPGEARGHSQGHLLHPRSASPVPVKETYNQEPTHSFLPETQHPISKIKHAQTDSELVFSTRQRTKPPGSQPHSHTLYTSTLELRITVEKLPSLGELLSKDCERGIGILGASKTPPHLPPLPPTYTKSQLPANVCHFKGKENNFF